MIWIILAGSIAFVLGGILAVRPTKAQKRVAEIREGALQSGLHVKLPVSLKFPEGIEKGRLPYYCRRLKEKDLQHRFYCAFRDGERIRTSHGDLSASQKAAIDEVLISAPSDIDSFYLGEGLLGFSWRESGDQQIFSELTACLERVQRLLGA